MKFYAVVAAPPASCESHKIAERIEQRILNSNPVMEAFGELGVFCTILQPHLFPLGFAIFRERGSALQPLSGLENDCPSLPGSQPLPRFPQLPSIKGAVTWGYSLLVEPRVCEIHCQLELVSLGSYETVRQRVSWAHLVQILSLHSVPNVPKGKFVKGSIALGGRGLIFCFYLFLFWFVRWFVFETGS